MRSQRERRRLAGIALSGSDSEENVNKALASGFLWRFVEPIDIDRLQQALIDIAAESSRPALTAE